MEPSAAFLASTMEELQVDKPESIEYEGEDQNTDDGTATMETGELSDISLLDFLSFIIGIGLLGISVFCTIMTVDYLNKGNASVLLIMWTVIVSFLMIIFGMFIVSEYYEDPEWFTAQITFESNSLRKKREQEFYQFVYDRAYDEIWTDIVENSEEYYRGDDGKLYRVENEDLNGNKKDVPSPATVAEAASATPAVSPAASASASPVGASRSTSPLAIIASPYQNEVVVPIDPSQKKNQ